MLDALERQTLTAIDRLTRDNHGYTDGDHLLAALRAEGVDADVMRLWRVLKWLASEDYLGAYFGANRPDTIDGVGNLRLTGRGREAAREAVDPFERMAADARRLLASDDFGRIYPDAFRCWSEAERLLWDEDSHSPSALTAVGHHAREAMQAFATALVNNHRPPDVESDVAAVEKRVGAVIALHRPALGTARREALEALGTLWRKTNVLVQRQEHGAQREGESLTWGDARRTVLLTMLCMLEIAVTLEGLRPPEVFLEGQTP